MKGFSCKISPSRFYNSKSDDFPTKHESESRASLCTTIQYQCESDRGRIINSAAVRRLQQKTQVFPLERNAAVRSRLTHSLEVMQVGRFITQSLVKKLTNEKSPYKEDIAGLEKALESIVEMSCLMHDIGNPPFGHFGERAISDWFNIHLPTNIPLALSPDHALVTACDVFPTELQKDLINFEGNAQGIRLITHLQKLNLTKTQIAAVLKYTRCGTDAKPASDNDPLYYLTKKVGYYYSEKTLVEEVMAFHDMKPGHRHPATYIMEAADDISYCIADLEDAVDKGILTKEQLKRHLLEEFEKLQPKSELMQKVVDFGKSWSTHDEHDDSQFFIGVRTKFILELVGYAAQTLYENFTDIIEGRYSAHILEDVSNPVCCLAKTMKTIAFKYVFCDKEVEAAELKGYTVITGLLDKYKPLLQVTAKTFQLALDNDKDVSILLSRLCKKLPPKHVRAYQEAIKQESGELTHLDNAEVKEYYYRCRLFQDIISGMTDQYAVDEYRELMGLDAV